MSLIDKNSKVKVDDLDDGQKQLVKQLENLVDDPSIDVIGLEGEWGSGKSTILKALEDTSKYNCYTYDLWAHQEDNLRYSFLRGLLERFEIFLLEEDKFKTFRNDIDDLISAKKESKPRINHKMVGFIFVMLLLPIFSKIAEVLWNERHFVYVIATFFFPVAIVSLLYLFNNKCNAEKKRRNNFLLNVAVIIFAVITIADFNYGLEVQDVNWGIYCVQVISLIFVGIFVIKLLRNISSYIKNPFVNDALSLYNDKLVETSYSTEIQPQMEDVRFFMVRFFSEINKNEGKKRVVENEEKKVIKRNEEKKIIIIFDNLDRLPNDKIKDFWTFLQTFFVGKKYKSVTTIVAYERKTVEKAWENGVGSAYLEKSLNYTLFVPLCSRMDLKKYFKEQWQKFIVNDKDNIEGTSENVFNLYHLLKKGSVGFSSRRGVIDAINEIKWEKEKIRLFFNINNEQKNICNKEYPFELAAMYVFRKCRINEMFSTTIKKDAIQYYINAFDECKIWIEEYVPGKDEDEKKEYLQQIFNQMIRNDTEHAAGMSSYYIADYFRNGKIEQYLNYAADDNTELKEDFDYIFFVALQRLEDDGKGVSNIVSSLLYCQKNEKMNDVCLKEKWIIIFNKMASLTKWPQNAWVWNALIHYANDYLQERIGKDAYTFVEPREHFFVEDLHSYYFIKNNLLEGKICLSEKYLTYYSFNNLHKHSLDKEGKNFFYTNEKEESIVVEQLNEFTQEDWVLSLNNFWNPGVLQYLNLKNKPNQPPKNLQLSLKSYFEHNSYKSIDNMNCVQKGPCSDDEYCEKWFELIKILKSKGESELKENIRKFFPKKYRTKVDEIIQDKKA